MPIKSLFHGDAHAQLHAMISASGFAAHAPRANAPMTSAMTAAGPRGAQRGHAGGCAMLDFAQQFVRFSDIVMQKMQKKEVASVKFL